MNLRNLIPSKWSRDAQTTDIAQSPTVRYQDPIDHFFEDFDSFFQYPFGGMLAFQNEFRDTLSPKVNVTETGKVVRIEAEIPGLD